MSGGILYHVIRGNVGFASTIVAMPGVRVISRDAVTTINRVGAERVLCPFGNNLVVHIEAVRLGAPDRTIT
jgi:hypothetical protein